MKIRFSNIIWGTFLLLAAAFILVNQFEGFLSIGAGSIIVTVLTIAFIVQCIASLRFAPLPIPLAILYIIYQKPLSLPEIQIWILILASILASAGLGIMFPKKKFYKYNEYKYCKKGKHTHQVKTEDTGNDNNPDISIKFGSISRRINADSLETIHMNCNFGALEVYFNETKLNPNGAEAFINCNFGAVELYIPRHWHIIDKINCSLGGVDIDKNHSTLSENAPKFTLTGDVSFGGIEVKYI